MTALSTTFIELFCNSTVRYHQRSPHAFDTVIAVEISLYFNGQNTLSI